ncbi:YciI family protein [Desulfovibrio inopinatus]|uniref:YciI family protein n=1 Tax=Desulfovibrio inopinatus TaxID=102109 RepID=UPI0003F67EED|nr:YciI family protein [Desulfovibrio inopinatus]
MFLISLTYTHPLEEVDALLAAHSAFLQKHYDAKKFLFSGRKIPRSGGLIVCKADSREEVEAIIAQDPFQDVAAYEIIEFSPTMAAPELAPFLLDA